jgi:hypothetical protein
VKIERYASITLESSAIVISGGNTVYLRVPSEQVERFKEMGLDLRKENFRVTCEESMEKKENETDSHCVLVYRFEKEEVQRRI